MRGSGSVDVALEQVTVRVDATVAQERPDAAHVLAALQVDIAQQHGGVRAGLGQELALRAEHVAVAPELDARGTQRRGFVADAVAAQHRQAVGHGMAAMAPHPGVTLAGLLVLHVVRSQPIAVGYSSSSAPASAIQARRFRYHWSQHTSTPRRPTEVSIGLKPMSPEVK